MVCTIGFSYLLSQQKIDHAELVLESFSDWLVSQ